MHWHWNQCWLLPLVHEITIKSNQHVSYLALSAIPNSYHLPPLYAMLPWLDVKGLLSYTGLTESFSLPTHGHRNNATLRCRNRRWNAGDAFVPIGIDAIRTTISRSIARSITRMELQCASESRVEYSLLLNMGHLLPAIALD